MAIRILRCSLFLAAALMSATADPQEPDRYVPVKAPYAQTLVRNTSAAHPEMTFIGLHVTPPGKPDNVIIACTDQSKIGRVSTELDMAIIKNKDTKVHFSKPRNDYEVDQWFSDAAGDTLGMIVFHFAGASTKSEDDAVRFATAIRAELQKSIPNRERLFQE